MKGNGCRKIKFNKDTEVNIVDKYDDVYSRNYARGYTIDIDVMHNNGSFKNLVLNNGEVLIDIPRNNITIIK